MKNVEICYATNNDYAPLVGVSMLSALVNKSDDTCINFYILNNEVSVTSRLKLKSLCKEFENVSITFHDVKPCIQKLSEYNVARQGKAQSLSSYARLFVSSLISDDVEKILYLDADTIVEDDLSELFETDLTEPVGAVIDILPNFHKKYIGFSQKERYYNSGVLLINLKKWRQQSIEKKLFDHILSGNTNYSFHDQDLINILFKGNIKTLEPKYMTFIPEYSWGKEKILDLTDLDSESYYSDQIVKNAAVQPVIIHLVDSIYGRPWYRYNNNPLKEKWISYLNRTEFKSTFQFNDNHPSIGNKLLKKLYLFGPTFIFRMIYKSRKNKVLFEREKKYERMRELNNGKENFS